MSMPGESKESDLISEVINRPCFIRVISGCGQWLANTHRVRVNDISTYGNFLSAIAQSESYEKTRKWN